MSVNPPLARRISRGLDGLWYVAGAPQVLIVLAVLLAVTVALAAVFPQLPIGLDAPAAERWLAATSAAYGSGAAFLRGIGIFSVLNTPWTRLLLAAFAFHLILRIGGQIAHWQRRRAYRRAGLTPPTPPYLPYAAVLSPLPADETAGNFAGALAAWQGRGASPLSAPATGAQAERQIALFAERRAWAAYGPLLAYLGSLIVLLGLLLNTMGGWRVADVALAAGETVLPAQARGLAVTLSAVGEGIAQLTLTRGENTRPVFIADGAPARWGGVWAAQRATGPALTVTVRDVKGNALPVQALAQPQNTAADATQPLILRFERGESEQAFAAAEPATGQELIIRAVSYAALPDRGIERPVFFVEGYRGDDPTPSLTELVEDAAEVTWAGLTFNFRRDRYVVVDLAALPGLPLLLLGGLTTLAGAILTLWLGNLRAWVHVTTTPDGVVAAVRGAGPTLPQETVARLVPMPQDGSAAPRSAYGATILLALLGVAAVIGLSVWLSSTALSAASQPLRAWSFLLRTLTGGIGLGLWPAAFVLSARFARQRLRAIPQTPESTFPQTGRPVDPARRIAAIGHPFLTAALIFAVLWNIQSYAAPWRAAAPDLWLLIAWLLSAVYLHATSPWRPLGLPAWFGTLLAAAAGGAALLAALSAELLLVR